MAKVVMYCTVRVPLLCLCRAPAEEPRRHRNRKDRIDLDPAKQDEMIARSGGRRTVPQVFIGDTHVGGFDDTSALDAAGKLVPLLNAS